VLQDAHCFCELDLCAAVQAKAMLGDAKKGGTAVFKATYGPAYIHSCVYAASYHAVITTSVTDKTDKKAVALSLEASFKTAAGDVATVKPIKNTFNRSVTVSAYKLSYMYTINIISALHVKVVILCCMQSNALQHTYFALISYLISYILLRCAV
jgi:hypothetical protein